MMRSNDSARHGSHGPEPRRKATPGIGRLFALFVTALAALAFVPTAAQAENNMIDSFMAGVFDTAGDPVTQAGAHPFRARTRFEIVQTPGLNDELRTVRVDLPPGFVVNPAAIPQCTRAQLWLRACPPESQVATVELPPIAGGINPVFNMVPRYGLPAEFGFDPDAITTVFVEGHVTSEGRLKVVVPNNSTAAIINFSDFKFFGVPADPANGTGTTAAEEAFVTNPTSCTGPVETVVHINSWQNPEYDTANDFAAAGTGCADLPFTPDVSVSAGSGQAGAPTSLSVDINVDQSQITDPGALAQAHVKRVEVALPEGMAVNPSAASGLGACSPEQIGLGSDAPARCPDASKIGSVEIESPLIEEQLRGAVYLAEPHNNPFGELLSLYLVPRSAERGIELKLPGKVEADPVTGRLTATFDDNPQLPFTHLSVDLFGGSRASLVNPDECGSHVATAWVSPWSAADPNSPTAAEIVTKTSSFRIDSGCGPIGFAPEFSAGSLSAMAGDSSPFVLRASRDDADGEFKTLDDIRLPEGLLGYISRVETCAAAHADLGICGPGSRVGRVMNSVGAGPRPAWIPQPGKTPTSVHLAGPYRGAPYSLSIVVPAQAGPFDLGRVVVRTPLHVNERTAQITTKVAESRVFNRAGQLTQHIQGGLPRMLEGIPLNIREIRVLADREGFMLNPTSCRDQAVTSDLVSVGGLHAAGSSPFAVAGCRALDFAPRFRAVIMNKGRRSTVRSFNPRTKFVVVPNKGDANIGGARVVLPSSTILDQANIGTTCTRAQMAAENCPEASIVGHAKAWSPVLNGPIQGPVYLAANGGVRPLPDLAAVLDGEVRLVLQGEISTLRTRHKARLQNTFRVVPDAPVSRFVLTMRGGKKHGLLVNSTDLCRSRERGVAVFTGQNGDRQRLRPRIATRFRGCRKIRRKTARRRAARKAGKAGKSQAQTVTHEARGKTANRARR